VGRKLEGEEEEMMKAFDKCPICGNEMVEKEVEKLLRGGKDTAVVMVKADVCLHCGERLYSEETVKKFEEIRSKLKRNETKEYQEIGTSYRAR
jgi:YgiT-type zinc finger domain-containing protein